MSLEREGGCLCGAVRFTARLTGTNFGVCHCPMCRKWTGSALLGMTVPEGNVEWSGLKHVSKRQSSPWAERAWCANCGSALWFRVTVDSPYSGTIELPIGLFDDANGLTLANEIYIDHKPDSYAFAGEERNVLTRADCIARFPLLAGGKSQIERHLSAHPLYLDYLPGRSAILVLAFTGVGDRKEEIPSPEAIRLTSLDGENHVVFISDASRSWMNADGLVETLVTAVTALIEKIKPIRIVAFGNSMGGSAALIFASLFRVDAVLAIVPQYSVKADLVPNEGRWTKWRNTIRNWRFPAVPDLAGQGIDVMILHGGDRREMSHAMMFRVGPGVDHYVVPQYGHALARCLKTTRHLGPLMSNVLAGNMAEARRVVESAGGLTFAAHRQQMRAARKARRLAVDQAADIPQPGLA